MKKLYKCYDPFNIELPEQVISLFAENEQAALRKCAEIHSELDIYDEPYETVINSWISDEFYLPPHCEAYICYPTSIYGEHDVRLIFVSDDVYDIERYIFEQLAIMESEDEIFRGYCNEYSINAGLLEDFYKVNGKYAFDDLYQDFPPRDDILDMFNGDVKKAYQYIDDCMMINVREFFSDCPILGDMYLSYLRSHDEDELDEEFYLHIASKFLQEDSWITYEDIRKVDIVVWAGNQDMYQWK